MGEHLPFPAVGFVGSSRSGKITLIERSVPLLSARGLRVLVASQRRWALLAEEAEPESEPSLARTLARFTPGEVDLVLVEGFAHERHPKIEVYRPSHGRPPKSWPGDQDVVAVATDGEIGASRVPRLALNDPEAIAEFVLWLAPGAIGARAAADRG